MHKKIVTIISYKWLTNVTSYIYFLPTINCWSLTTCIYPILIGVQAKFRAFLILVSFSSSFLVMKKRSSLSRSSSGVIGAAVVSGDDDFSR